VLDYERLEIMRKFNREAMGTNAVLLALGSMTLVFTGQMDGFLAALAIAFLSASWVAYNADVAVVLGMTDNET